jgi:hypothetical protein
MGKKKERIVPTLENNVEKEQQEVTTIVAPVEIHFHIAGANVQKVATPLGMMTILSLISPTGLAVSVQLSDSNVEELIKDLQGNISSIDTYTTLPPRISK